ncbi:SSTR5 [Branchiostoma lanceolatum]|uniref:SSTR5 protein n=2 Tax=Branchiostoma lanceolatum TaxID=7740 RepID=A0A8K0ED46_BRALA|nr:SSTR5 [Branchiostoma lanceolatum]
MTFLSLMKVRHPDRAVGVKMEDYYDFPYDISNYTSFGNETYVPIPYSWGIIIYNIVAPIIQCAIGITGLVGNGLIIYVIIKYPTMKTVPNMYVLNLAISDFLYCLTFPIWAADYILRVWIFGQAMCKIVRSIFNINTFASIYFLTVMSIERYYAILHPVRNIQNRSLKKAKIISGCIWTVALMCSLPYIVFAETDYLSGVPVCLFKWPANVQNEDWWRGANAVYLTALAFLIPLCIMVPNYVLIYRKLRNTDFVPPESRRALRSRHRVTRMVIVVVVIFIICWMPLHVGNIIRFVFGFKVNATAWYFLNVIADVNSCVNPFLYALLGQNFRATLKRTLCGSSCCPDSFRQESRRANFRDLASVRSTTTAIEMTTLRTNNSIEWPARSPLTFRTSRPSPRRQQTIREDGF